MHETGQNGTGFLTIRAHTCNNGFAVKGKIGESRMQNEFVKKEVGKPRPVSSHFKKKSGEVA